jgi:hypothetical protein
LSSGIIVGPGARIVGAAAKPADTSQAGFDKPRILRVTHHNAFGNLVGSASRIQGAARVTRTGQNPLALLMTSA